MVPVLRSCAWFPLTVLLTCLHFAPLSPLQVVASRVVEFFFDKTVERDDVNIFHMRFRFTAFRLTTAISFYMAAVEGLFESVLCRNKDLSREYLIVSFDGTKVSTASAPAYAHSSFGASQAQLNDLLRAYFYYILKSHVFVVERQLTEGEEVESSLDEMLVAFASGASNVRCLAAQSLANFRPGPGV